MLSCAYSETCNPNANVSATSVKAVFILRTMVVSPQWFSNSDEHPRALNFHGYWKEFLCEGYIHAKEKLTQLLVALRRNFSSVSVSVGRGDVAGSRSRQSPKQAGFCC
jgi:hypothetical protein